MLKLIDRGVSYVLLIALTIFAGLYLSGCGNDAAGAVDSTAGEVEIEEADDSPVAYPEKPDFISVDGSSGALSLDTLSPLFEGGKATVSEFSDPDPETVDSIDSISHRNIEEHGQLSVIFAFDSLYARVLLYNDEASPKPASECSVYSLELFSGTPETVPVVSSIGVYGFHLGDAGNGVFEKLGDADEVHYDTVSKSWNNEWRQAISDDPEIMRCIYASEPTPGFLFTFHISEDDGLIKGIQVCAIDADSLGENKLDGSENDGGQMATHITDPQHQSEFQAARLADKRPGWSAQPIEVNGVDVIIGKTTVGELASAGTLVDAAKISEAVPEQDRLLGAHSSFTLTVDGHEITFDSALDEGSETWSDAKICDISMMDRLAPISYNGFKPSDSPTELVEAFGRPFHRHQLMYVYHDGGLEFRVSFADSGEVKHYDIISIEE